jgi:Tfp pilus assembly protein PilE
MNRMQQSKGVSLLEVMLVFAVATMLLLFSIKQYQNFETEANARQIQYNVDMIFQAMALYYKANCNHPVFSQLGSYTFFPVSINDLFTQGYLAALPPTNPIITKYIAQFNEEQLQSRTINATSNMNSPSPTAIGKIVIVMIQVSVK